MGKIFHEERLNKVHPDLIKVIKHAAILCEFDVVIIEGARSAKEHAYNLKHGLSRTQRSRHVISNNKCGYACAVDMAPYIKGQIPWKQWDLFAKLNKHVAVSERIYNVCVEWGGDWKGFKDGNHWQLPWHMYS